MRDNCLYCGDNITEGQSFFDYLKKEDMLCGNCKSRLQELRKFYDWKGIKILVLYAYNDFMESLLFQFKHQGDIALAPVFLNNQWKYLKRKYRKHIFIFPPSSKSSTKQRGFVPLLEITKCLANKKISPFQKDNNFKQSSTAGRERYDIQNHISLFEGIDKDKHYVMFDDVVTSGSTLQTCLSLLEEIEITVVVLSATQAFLDSCKQC